jgi:hypothetical protein
MGLHCAQGGSSICCEQICVIMHLREELLAHGFAGGAIRLDKLVRFLVNEEFDSVADLAGASSVSKFRGASDLEPADLVFLQTVVNTETARHKAHLRKRSLPSVEVDPRLQAVGLGNIIAQAMPRAKAKCVGTTRGPLHTLRLLDESLPDRDSKDKWLATARVDALVSASKGSIASVNSGVKCYLKFALLVLGKCEEAATPPTVDDLLAWSMMFRHPTTFSNYLGYLKLGCMLVRKPTSVFDDPAVKRAKRGVAKRMNFKPRPPMFLQHNILSDMFERVYTADRIELEQVAMLFLVTYVFLLRLPSEALPIVRGCVGVANNSQSSLYLSGDMLYLKLAKRKNKPNGSLLKRGCWCCSCKLTCPIHSLWMYFEADVKIGHRAFAQFTPASALRRLRGFLKELQVADAGKYRTHDFRRGHAKDMQLNGSTLYQILMAGEWRSPTFMSYMDLLELEMGATMEAHMAESSSEDESGED